VMWREGIWIEVIGERAPQAFGVDKGQGPRHARLPGEILTSVASMYDASTTLNPGGAGARGVWSVNKL
jgi:hypothetical protein